MRYAVIVSSPSSEVLYGSFKTPAAAEQMARQARHAGAQARVVPIYSRGTFTTAAPTRPKEKNDAR